MKRLILMRHAKSDWSAGQQNDHDRVLNARGRQSAEALGGWLKTEGVLPDQILCSDAQRTRETLHLLDLPQGIDTTFTRALYLATHNEMLGELRQATGDTVLMVGHNPGISIVASQIVGEAPGHPRFEEYLTGATLVATLNVEGWQDVEWGTAKVMNFVVPADL